MNHSIRWSTFQVCSLTLCIFCVAAGNESRAKEPEGDLGAGEAFVIVKVTGDVKALAFQRFQRAESFVAERHYGGQLIRVKAGRYYLKNVTPVHMGIKLLSNPEPSEPSQTVAVREGLVNYIGDWNFIEEPTASDIRYDFELKFDLETVKKTVKKNNIAKYSLMVSKLGDPPIKTAMP